MLAWENTQYLIDSSHFLVIIHTHTHPRLNKGEVDNTNPVKSLKREELGREMLGISLSIGMDGEK